MSNTVVYLKPGKFSLYCWVIPSKRFPPKTHGNFPHLSRSSPPSHSPVLPPPSVPRDL